MTDKAGRYGLGCIELGKGTLTPFSATPFRLLKTRSSRTFSVGHPLMTATTCICGPFAVAGTNLIDTRPFADLVCQPTTTQRAPIVLIFCRPRTREFYGAPHLDFKAVLSHTLVSPNMTSC